MRAVVSVNLGRALLKQAALLTASSRNPRPRAGAGLADRHGLERDYVVCVSLEAGGMEADADLHNLEL
jgi:hypothetical protein